MYKLLGLSASLGLHFFSMKASVYIKTKILTPNKICMPFLLLICLLSISFTGPETAITRLEGRFFPSHTVLYYFSVYHFSWCLCGVLCYLNPDHNVVLVLSSLVFRSVVLNPGQKAE